MNNDTTMLGSIDDLGSLVHQVESSFRSMDIDDIFSSDDSRSHDIGREGRQKRYQAMQNASTFLVSQNESNPAYGPKSYGTKLSTTIPNEFLTMQVLSMSSNIMVGGSLSKMDRASTLGSFTFSSQSLDSATGPSNDKGTAARQNSRQPDCSRYLQQSSRGASIHGTGMELHNKIDSTREMQDAGRRGLVSDMQLERRKRVEGSAEPRDWRGLAAFRITSTMKPIAVANDNATKVLKSPMIGEGSGAPISMPSENDVLLGRGGKNNQWSGNEKLRIMAQSMSESYGSASKRDKPALAWTLVEEMRKLEPPTRFLKQGQYSGSWVEVDDVVAREKASQCLRDIVALRLKVTKTTDRTTEAMQHNRSTPGVVSSSQHAMSSASENDARRRISFHERSSDNAVVPLMTTS